MRIHRLWALTAIALLATAAGFAQTNATLTGTVSDSSGAVIPAAEIVIMNMATGEAYESTTNETGTYTIPFIKPGTFELIVTSPGFKQFTRPGILLDTASNVRADAVLEVGEVTESVTVEADVPLLKTENSSVGAVIKNTSIANMPLLGRRAAQLVRLSGFVVQRGNGSQFQIAGGRSNNAMWTLDGGSTQNILLGVASLNYDPPIEALEEMNVEVSNYKAEMGRSGGGFIQMTTKSGTNRFHGALYDFLRNDAMDSRHFFSGSNKQVLRRNQYGWALGGPIAKDRSFFFASQEFTKQRTANPRIENIPDPAETRGRLLRPRHHHPEPGDGRCRAQQHRAGQRAGSGRSGRGQVLARAQHRGQGVAGAAISRTTGATSTTATRCRSASTTPSASAIASTAATCITSGSRSSSRDSGPSRCTTTSESTTSTTSTGLSQRSRTCRPSWSRRTASRGPSASGIRRSRPRAWDSHRRSASPGTIPSSSPASDSPAASSASAAAAARSGASSRSATTTSCPTGPT